MITPLTMAVGVPVTVLAAAYFHMYLSLDS
jgi:hypothetical protein